MNFQIQGGSGLAETIQDRATAPNEVSPDYGSDAVSRYAFWMLGLSENYNDYSDYIINAETAMKYSAIWACVRWITQSIASLCWNVFEYSDRKKNQIPLDDRIAWMLEMEANAEQTAFAWREVMVKDALLLGNGYSEVDKDGFGRIGEMWYLENGRVAPDRTASGALVYEVENGSGIRNTILRPDQVFHLKGLGDGISGYSVIAMARQDIKSARAQGKFGYDFFSRGPTPAGIYSSPTKGSPQAEKEARESFDRLYSGRNNVGRVIRLTGASTFTPLSLPNDDAQFVESQTFSLETFCRWFGVPPHKIADLSKSTNNNIEHQAIEAVQDCLWPWCRRLETQANVKLFGRVNRGTRRTKLDLQQLLRGDSVATADSLGKQVTSGIRKINEAREVIDLDPVPEGETLMIQGAMVPLETAQNPPQATPSTPPAKDGSTSQAPVEYSQAAFVRLLTDAYSRQLRIESEKAVKAAKHGKLSKWCDEFYSSQTPLRELTDALAPIFEAILGSQNKQLADSIARSAAERHVEWSRRILIDSRMVPADWEKRAAPIAEAEFAAAIEHYKGLKK